MPTPETLFIQALRRRWDAWLRAKPHRTPLHSFGQAWPIALYGQNRHYWPNVEPPPQDPYTRLHALMWSRADRLDESDGTVRVDSNYVAVDLGLTDRDLMLVVSRTYLLTVWKSHESRATFDNVMLAAVDEQARRRSP